MLKKKWSFLQKSIFTLIILLMGKTINISAISPEKLEAVFSLLQNGIQKDDSISSAQDLSEQNLSNLSEDELAAYLEKQAQEKKAPTEKQEINKKYLNLDAAKFLLIPQTSKPNEDAIKNSLFYLKNIDSLNIFSGADQKFSNSVLAKIDKTHTPLGLLTIASMLAENGNPQSVEKNKAALQSLITNKDLLEKLDKELEKFNMAFDDYCQELRKYIDKTPDLTPLNQNPIKKYLLSPFWSAIKETGLGMRDLLILAAIITLGTKLWTIGSIAALAYLLESLVAIFWGILSPIASLSSLWTLGASTILPAITSAPGAILSTVASTPGAILSTVLNYKMWALAGISTATSLIPKGLSATGIISPANEPLAGMVTHIGGSSLCSNLTDSPWYLWPILTSPITGTINFWKNVGSKFLLNKNLNQAVNTLINKTKNLLGSAQEISTTLNQNPELKSLSSNLNNIFDTQKSNTSVLAFLLKQSSNPEIIKNGKQKQELFSNILTETIKIKNSTSTQQAFPEILSEIGQLDALVSIAKLYKEKENTPNKYCLVNYDTNKTLTSLNFENLWNPANPSGTFNINLQKISFVPNTNIVTDKNQLEAIGTATVLSNIGIAPAQKATITPIKHLMFGLTPQYPSYEILNLKNILTSVNTMPTSESGLILIDNSRLSNLKEDANLGDFSMYRTIIDLLYKKVLPTHNFCTIATAK